MEESTKQYKVIIANDDPAQLYIQQILFEELDFQVETAKNGYDVFQKVQKNKNCVKYDVILLDLQMPIMNGFDACRNICNLFEESLFAVDNRRGAALDNEVSENLMSSSIQEHILMNVEKKIKKMKPLIIASTGLLSEQVILETNTCGFDRAFQTISMPDIKGYIMPELENRRRKI